jgi:hypothetical protein
VNLTLLLDVAADGFGDRTVIGVPGTSYTAQDVRAHSFGGARLLAGASALVYLDVNGPVFPMALFAAARAGCHWCR